MAPQKYTEQDLLDNLQNLDEQVEDNISVSQFKQLSDISLGVYIQRFGTFNEAKEEAGLETNKPLSNRKKTYSKEELLDHLRYLDEQVEGSVPMSYVEEHGIMGTSIYGKVFGSFNAAKKQAGIEYTESGETAGIKYDRDELVQHLKDLQEENGYVSINMIQRTSGVPAYSTFIYEFGTFEEALDAADARTYDEAPKEDVNPLYISKDKVLEDVKQVAEKYTEEHFVDEKTTTSTYYQMHGNFAMPTVRSKFGDWNDVLEEAGLSTVKGPKFKEDVLEHWKQQIVDEGLEGSVEWVDFKEALDTVDGVSFSRNAVNELAKYLQENLDRHVHKTDSGGPSRNKIYIRPDYLNRYNHLLDELDEKLHELFMQGLQTGRSPSGLAAALKYIFNEDFTQAKCGELFDTTTVTVRHNVKFYQDDFDSEISELKDEVEGGDNSE